MEKEPSPQKWQQGNLDFNNQGLRSVEGSKTRPYLNYPPEERERLRESILSKRRTGERLTEEELVFQEADKNFFTPDDQDRHGR